MSKYDLISKLLSKKDANVNILGDLYNEKEFNFLSEWLLFNAKWANFQLYHGKIKLHSGQVNYCHHFASDIVFRSLRWWVITYKKIQTLDKSIRMLPFSPYMSYTERFWWFFSQIFSKLKKYNLPIYRTSYLLN